MLKKGKKIEKEPKKVVAKCNNLEEVIANYESQQVAVANCDHEKPIEDKNTPICIHT